MKTSEMSPTNPRGSQALARKSHAGVGQLAAQITCRQSAVFGCIARLADSVPARLALRCQIDASLGRLPSNTWKRRPGRPRNRWLDLVRQDSNCSTADLWRRAVLRGHGARTMLRRSPTMRTVSQISIERLLVKLAQCTARSSFISLVPV